MSYYSLRLTNINKRLSDINVLGETGNNDSFINANTNANTNAVTSGTGESTIRAAPASTPLKENMTKSFAPQRERSGRASLATAPRIKNWYYKIKIKYLYFIIPIILLITLCICKPRFLTKKYYTKHMKGKAVELRGSAAKRYIVFSKLILFVALVSIIMIVSIRKMIFELKK